MTLWYGTKLRSVSSREAAGTQQSSASNNPVAGGCDTGGCCARGAYSGAVTPHKCVCTAPQRSAEHRLQMMVELALASEDCDVRTACALVTRTGEHAVPVTAFAAHHFWTLVTRNSGRLRPHDVEMVVDAAAAAGLAAALPGALAAMRSALDAAAQHGGDLTRLRRRVQQLDAAAAAA